MEKLLPLFIVLFASLAWAQAPKAKPAPAPEISAPSPAREAWLTRRVELTVALEKLLKKYSHQHKDVIEVKAQIAEIDATIAKLPPSPALPPTLAAIVLQREQLKLASLRTMMLEEYKPDSPEVKDLDARILALDLAISKLPPKLLAQASQIASESDATVQRIIALQNERIIELLEQLVKKR